LSGGTLFNHCSWCQGCVVFIVPVAHFPSSSSGSQAPYTDLNWPNNAFSLPMFLIGYEVDSGILLNDSHWIMLITDKQSVCVFLVYFRMFGLTPHMEPVVNDINTDTSISIEIETPDGIILPLDSISLNSGMHSGHYQLNEIVSPGLWKIVAKFQSNPQESFSANFEVKEYVLPSFEVKLSSLRPFFYVDSETLEIDIKARYLFGREVNGNAYVVFGIIDQGQKKSLPDSLSRVPIENGEGKVVLKREHITKTFSDINQLVGSSIFVSVSVLTDSGKMKTTHPHMHVRSAFSGI
uniref:Uncharacterized protein n=1 Tax=Oryzias melastigma TaxID=30732 RepID=A0A3B3C415_ORYME